MTSPPAEARATVGSVMHSGVVTCRPDATLRTVAGILAAHRIHAVIVASPDEAAPCAVVTDRDVVFGHSLGKLDQREAEQLKPVGACAISRRTARRRDCNIRAAPPQAQLLSPAAPKSAESVGPRLSRAASATTRTRLRI
jgi:hypothetical protein